jgi:Protein of unknown function (DUF2946)
MGIGQSKKRFAAWIACFAVLLAALAPSISHFVYVAKIPATHSTNHSATHHGESVPTAETELSDMAGHDHGHASPVPAESDMADHHHASASHTPADKGMHFEHCPFCFTHAGSFGLSPVAALTHPVVNGSSEFPSLFYQSPQPLFVWATAQARAPPVHS